MERIGMPGESQKNAAIQAFGIIPLPRTMEPGGFLNRLVNYHQVAGHTRLMGKKKGRTCSSGPAFAMSRKSV
jgi:hypothetical protein